MSKIIHGDSIEELKKLESDSVDSIVTDPPYGLKFMGKKWDYEVPSTEVWVECLRVLKPGGHMLVACGSRTQHRMAVNIEDAGFEIRDVITWLYGSGFPKSLDISKAIDKAAGAERARVPGGQGAANSILGSRKPNEAISNEAISNEAKQWQGWGTALKPACEFWTLARKPLGETTVAKNVLKHGTGGINVDGCRVESESNEHFRSFVKKPENSQRQTYDGARPNNDFEPTNSSLGRFPANLILDEEAGAALDEQSGNCGAQAPVKKKVTPVSTNIENYKPHPSVGDDGASFRGDSGGASRFFYCAKASKSERGADNVHPTVKPVKLMRYLCKLITPSGGTVLDPFMGSGTTGVAALAEGFDFLGIEREAEYIEIARRRCEAQCKL